MFEMLPRLPEPALIALAVWFLAGTIFYGYRLLFPDVVYKSYGYTDWQGEILHGACLFGMVPHLSPSLIPLPNWMWTAFLATVTVLFLVRACITSIWRYLKPARLPLPSFVRANSLDKMAVLFLLRTRIWGRKTSRRKGRSWYGDWVHVIMISGMTAWSAGLLSPWLHLPLAFFWAWLFNKYVDEFVHDLPKRKPLSIGSDVAHGSMGLVMFLMTVAPASFMGHSMSEMPRVAAITNEASARSLISDTSRTTLLYVWGGCENCNRGALAFTRVRDDFCSPTLQRKLQFAKVDKDKIPSLCQELGIKKCPMVLVFKRGVPVDRLQDVTDDQQLTAFVMSQVNRS
jgi:hypothetical protein